MSTLGGYELERHTTTWHCDPPGDGQVYAVVRQEWSFPNGMDHQPHRDIYEVQILHPPAPQ